MRGSCCSMRAGGSNRLPLHRRLTNSLQMSAKLCVDSASESTNSLAAFDCQSRSALVFTVIDHVCDGVSFQHTLHTCWSHAYHYPWWCLPLGRTNIYLVSYGKNLTLHLVSRPKGSGIWAEWQVFLFPDLAYLRQKWEILEKANIQTKKL